MNYFDFDKKIISASEKAEEMANEAFQKTNYITELNQRKMLKAISQQVQAMATATEVERLLTKYSHSHLMRRTLLSDIIS